ncbi:hypothetical protein KY348_02650 [Candidatus Woesearchaeota archaeon]|nr:hypothetical protein [Candidatus Woesearchaeota archaeon]
MNTHSKRLRDFLATQKYHHTNENLRAILRGLDIKPEDYALMVGGSGDQAFAVLEHAKKVLAVDISAYQVDYIKKQARSIEIGDYKNFWLRRQGGGGDPFNRSGGEPYLNKDRIDKIRKKLSFLEIREADIIDVCLSENGFDKVYLSNAINHLPDVLIPKLKVISNSMPLGGLLYASNREIIADSCVPGSGFEITQQPNMIEDHSWDSIVLRKTHEPEPITELESALL